MKKIITLILAFVLICSITACGSRAETVKIEKLDAKMIAHRGLSGLAVENTNSAFELAGQHSYYGIEADVRRTADGKFVICHDDTLERTAGRDVAVEGLTLTELLNIPLYDKNTKKTANERLTDLDSYLSICKKYDKQAILEFKSRFTHQEIDAIIQTIQAHDYTPKTTIISFNYDELLYVREKLPNQPVMYLFSDPSDEITQMVIRDKIDVGIKHTALTKSLLKTYKDAGLKVNCWTVDSKARAEHLAKLGVDYITSNILE